MARKQQKNLNIGVYDKGDPELKWINSQHKAGRSIQFLINMAIKAFGEDTDIIKLFIREGAKGNQLVSGIKPVGTTDIYFEPAEKKSETSEKDISDLIEKVDEPEKNNKTKPNSDVSSNSEKKSNQSIKSKNKVADQEPKKKRKENHTESTGKKAQQSNDTQREMLDRLSNIEG